MRLIFTSTFTFVSNQIVAVVVARRADSCYPTKKLYIFIFLPPSHFLYSISIPILYFLFDSFSHPLTADDSLPSLHVHCFRCFWEVLCVSICGLSCPGVPWKDFFMKISPLCDNLKESFVLYLVRHNIFQGELNSLIWRAKTMWWGISLGGGNSEIEEKRRRKRLKSYF